MSGLVSTVSNTLYGQQSPAKYNANQSYSDQERAAQLQAKYGLYGVESPLGSTSVVQNEDGTYSRTFTPSESDVTRNALISQGLSGLSLDPTEAQNAYYAQATRQLLPEFERQTQSLDENLINRGLGVGTEQYNQQMENLQNTQQGTLSDIANQSVYSAQDLLGSQIGNINSLAGGRDIYSLANLATGTGASITPTYDKQLDAINNRRMWQNQQNRQFMEGFYGGL